jgi:hypothetical protein
MRDFCEGERLRDGKYLGAGEKEREGGHWPGEGKREMWLAAGKEIEINYLISPGERAMMREIWREINFLVMSRAN